MLGEADPDDGVLVVRARRWVVAGRLRPIGVGATTGPMRERARKRGVCDPIHTRAAGDWKRISLGRARRVLVYQARFRLTAWALESPPGGES